MAARVGEQSAVVWKRLYRAPSSARRCSALVWIGPPNVLGCPNPTSSSRMISTFGAPLGAANIAGTSGSESAYVVPILPLNLRGGTGITSRAV